MTISTFYFRVPILSANFVEDNIKTWLKNILQIYGVDNFYVKILKENEEDKGLFADIVFVDVNGKNRNGLQEKFNFALKCSKEGEVLRQVCSIKDLYLSEIWLYEKVVPFFNQFESEKGILNPFDSIPKYYGFFTNHYDKEVLVLDNLYKLGYNLMDGKHPLRREYIDIVIAEFGKFHALSAAMKVQKPEIFKQLLEGLPHGYFKILTPYFATVNQKLIDEIISLLGNDLDNAGLLKLQNFKHKINYTVRDMLENKDGFNVITHNDCWIKNYMFLNDIKNENKPSKVAILDWQQAEYFSPVIDVSYFLFACISKEDINDIDSILKHYYKVFRNYLENLGSNADSIYTYSQFFQDWNYFCKYGFLRALLPIKFQFCAPEDSLDVAKTVKNGEDPAGCFIVTINDKIGFKNRIIPIVKYAVKNDLI